jgi:GH15 family glucan-1,4-alpha-glucosidase
LSGPPRIGDYALVGDCRSAALVASNGAVDWLCLPNMPDRALLGGILDPARGGHLRVAPADRCTVRRRYLPRTNVLETTFTTASGAMVLTDCMPVLAGSPLAPGLHPQRELLRRVVVTRGEVDCVVDFAPRSDYGRAYVPVQRRGNLGFGTRHGSAGLMLASTLPLALDADGCRVHGRVRLAAGARHFVSLTYARGAPLTFYPLADEGDARIEATAAWWRRWCARCRYDGPYRAAVERSLLTLKLLTYGLSGAVLAAPTTALPEWIGGPRNWDYRYCWLRDAAFVVRAFDDLGYSEEAQDFLRWLLHATRLTWPRLAVMYDVYGRRPPRERELAHLAGYRGSRPVRVGNGAAGQRQLDVYGEVVLASFEHVQRGGRLEAADARHLAGLARSVCALWEQPDQGIWELRGAPRHHVHSKVMCWVALDRLVRLHDEGVLRGHPGPLRAVCDRIAHAVRTRGLDPAGGGGYAGAFGDAHPDAALLLLPRLGFEPPDSPHMRATFARIEAELTDGALVYRYPPGSDGLPGPEGAFGVCSFWAVDYLARRGDLAAARERFERLLRYANDVGLYGEQIHPDDGSALGNFPQAFTHVGLINAALALGAGEAHEPASHGA